MKGANKVIAIVLIAFLSAGILFSSGYIIENAHHDCSGADCSVCTQLREAVQFISSIRFIPVRSFIMAVLCAFALGIASVKNHIGVKNTLITLKVELLN